MLKKVVLTLALLSIFSSVAFAAGKVHWGYSGHEGPENWGNLAPGFKLCSEGKQQSPIDIGEAVETDLPAINFNYKKVPVEVLNNGHTIQANYQSGSSIKVDGRTYDLKQFHFHAPSENTIGGRSFPLEVHMVHADQEGNLAVVGLMFEEGAANPLLKQVWEYMPEDAGAKNTNNKETLNVENLLPSNREYFAFSGSLTTPPCSEGVNWMVLKTPAEASAAQISKFEHTMHHANNRPVQPLNGRMVFK